MATLADVVPTRHNLLVAHTESSPKYFTCTIRVVSASLQPSWPWKGSRTVKLAEVDSIALTEDILSYKSQPETNCRSHVRMGNAVHEEEWQSG